MSFIVGKVSKIIDKMTAIVSFYSLSKHVDYRKIIKTSYSRICHIPSGIEVKIGHIVSVKNCPPISKRKNVVICSVL